MDNLKKVLTNRPELSGLLYKYTNVVKGKSTKVCLRKHLIDWFAHIEGFQMRFCRVDAENGILCYYLSENPEEHASGNPRGQVHLMGALINPSDEDSRTFTINPAAGETIKLKANDARSRQEVKLSQTFYWNLYLVINSVGRWAPSCRWEYFHSREISASAKRAPCCIRLPHSLPKTASRHRNVQCKTPSNDRKLTWRSFEP